MVEKKVLLGTTVGMAALEAVMVFATEFWVAGLVMAVVFAACAWRLTRPGRHVAVLVVLALAFLLELVPLPFFPRASVGDWVTQGLAGALSLVGLIVAARALARSGRQRDPSLA